jgi:hypothetical protein
MSAGHEVTKPLWIQLGRGQGEGSPAPSSWACLDWHSLPKQPPELLEKCAYHSRGLSGVEEVPADRI